LAAPAPPAREQAALALAFLARSGAAAHARVFGALCAAATAARGAAAPLVALEPLYHAGPRLSDDPSSGQDPRVCLS